MVFSLTATTWRLSKRANRTSINTNHLARTWRVEIKKKESIKEGGDNGRKGLRKKEKNIVTLRTNFVIKPEKIYKNWSPQTVPMTIFFSINLSSFIHLSSGSTLMFFWFINTQFSNTFFTNSLFWTFWTEVHPPFGLRTQI